MIIGAIKGAIVGAAIGAAISAATGGDIGQGAMLGAISGAFLGGTNGIMGHFIKQGVTYSSGIQVLAYAETGAYSGALGALASGSDPGRGAGFGALSGAVFGGIGGLGGENWKWDLARVALAGIAGGGISELAGGSFLGGSIFAGSIAGADFLYRAFIRTEGYEQGASMKTANRSGQPKVDSKGRALKVIHDPTSQGAGISNVGGQSMPGAKGFWHFWGGETGPVMSTIAKFIPGFQGLSHVHDTTSNYLVHQVGEKAFMSFLNFQTMPPIYGLNAAGAAINDNPALIGIYEVYGDE